MTVAEKRTTLKDYADTMNPEMLDRVLSFVIKINNVNDTTGSDDDTVTYRDATDEEVDDALDYINRNYSKAMERLAQ